MDGVLGVMTTRKRINSPATCTSNSSGFSLIEVAIALVVIGLLLVTALQMYNIYSKNKILREVRTDLQVVQTALQRYVYRYGRYPLPSPRNAAQGSSDYGREVTWPVTTNCSSAAATAGAVCITHNGAVDTAADGDASPDYVLIGDVPFATLGIKYNNTIDPYGGKLIYAVTANLTQSGASYNNSWGAIEVLNENAAGTVFSTSPSRAHFIIVSTGPDKKGAFGISGKLIEPCGAAAGTDQENCDLDAVFVSNQSISNSKPRIYEAAGPNHFDDYTGYINSTNSGIWTRVAATTIGQIDITSTNPENIKIGAIPTGVGTLGEITTCKAKCIKSDGTPESSCESGCSSNTSCTSECAGNCTTGTNAEKDACKKKCGNCTSRPRTKIDVEGSVRANEIFTDRWCPDKMSTGCLPNTTIPLPAGILSPRTLGGTPKDPPLPYSGSNNTSAGGGILCASELAMRGISMGDEICSYTARFDTPGSLNMTCPSGYYAKGRNTDGKICCSNTTCY